MNMLMKLTWTIALSTIVAFGTVACGGGGSSSGGGGGEVPGTPQDPPPENGVDTGTSPEENFEMTFDFEARALSTTRILLTWNPSESDLDNFWIQRSEDGVTYEFLQAFEGNRRFYSDITLEKDKTHLYRIRASRNYKLSVYSQVAIATTHQSAVSAGNFHTLRLKADGTVWAWGKNKNSQLGNGRFYGTEEKSNYPVQAKRGANTPLENMVAISAGGFHSLALADDGTVWAFGLNSSGQLGDGQVGTGTQSYYSVQVKKDANTPLQNIVAISAGTTHSLALAADGTVWAWGANFRGQLGNGKKGTTQDDEYESENYPVKMKIDTNTSLENIVAIYAGGEHSLALKSDGTVWATGYNEYGQLGNGKGGDGELESYAVRVKKNDNANAFLENIVSIAAGYNHSLALKANGTAWAWGKNEEGQLGHEGPKTMDFCDVPVRMEKEDKMPIDHIVFISAGGDHSLVIVADGTAWACGKNDYNQLTYISLLHMDNSLNLVQVNKSVYLSLENIVAISAGGSHSIVLLSDGTVWAWGHNDKGQLGIGNDEDQRYPVQISGME